MTRTRLMLVVLAGTAALSALALDWSLGPPEQRIHVRWAAGVADADRTALERELDLGDGVLHEGRTWRYVPGDSSRSALERIVRHPAVEDTYHIDREQFTVARAPRTRAAWVQRVHRSTMVRPIGGRLPAIAVVLVLLGLVAAWPGVKAMSRETASVAMVAVLAGSMLLRLALSLQGGQYYWPDESRYGESRKMMRALTEGRADLAATMLDDGQHPLFKVVGVIPAAIEILTDENARIPGVFFALFSVFDIWLIGRIARRLGAGRTEALLASACLALSSAFLYPARHLVPYDTAIAFGLSAVYVGVGPRGAGASLACGLLAACTLLTYTGYWTLAAAAMAVHAGFASHWREAARRSVLAAAASTAAVGSVVGASALLGGHMLENAREFSAHVTQGSFAEGWRLPLEYLWHAEHLVGVIWLAGIIACVWRLRAALSHHSLRAGLIGIVVVYGGLALTSTVLHAFVVYGRLVRQLVPFVCLVVAGILAGWCRSRHSAVRLTAIATIGIMCVQAALNLAPLLRQVFPAEFVRRARAAGHAEVPGAMLVNSTYLDKPPAPPPSLPGYTEVMSAPHPLQYLPYQYEGYTPEERAALRKTEIRMRVLIPAR